jgi:hypothetical protein
MLFNMSGLVLVGHLGTPQRPAVRCILCCDHLEEIANAKARRRTGIMLYAQIPSSALVDKLTE